MIINLPTISNKRIVSNPDGTQILELGESVFNYKREAIVIDSIMVTQDQAGKPWLIAQSLYLKESALAAFFFLNGYSNPYSVNEGDKLLRFDDDTLNNIVVDNNAINKEFYNVKTQDVASSKKKDKLTKIDQNRQALLAKIASPDQNVIAPNESTGVPPTSSADGVITLGTDVSDARCKSNNLSDTQTRTELIRAAIKKKLGV